MVQDFEEVRSFLNIENWLTLGHSIGGILQMGYVKKHPEVISGMIFINCTLDMTDSFGNSWLPKAIEILGNDAPEACEDSTVSIYNRMLALMPILNEKGKLWKIFFKNQEDNQRMNQTYAKFKAWNNDQSEKILEMDEYWNDYRKYSKYVKQPVLFYYGETDWAIGPEHFREVKFPKVILWGYNGGHMPFLENRSDLINALDHYIEQYSF